MTPFESYMQALHSELERTDGRCVEVNFRHDDSCWLLWLGDGVPQSSRVWMGLKGEIVLRMAIEEAESATRPGWWRC